MKLMLVMTMAAIVFGGGSVKADFTFGIPSKVPNVSVASDDANPEISSDGLSLFFASGNRPGGYGSYDIWVATRATTEDEWSEPMNLGPPVNSSAFEDQPSISADGLHLYFGDGRSGDPSRPNRPGGYGGADLWVSTRATKDDPWGEPVNLGPIVNSSASESDPSISTDGLTLFFHSDRAGYGECDIWVTTRPTTLDSWGPPVNLEPTVNSVDWDGDSEISSDGRVLFFNSDRPGGYGAQDIYITMRATTSDPWGPPLNVGQNINSDNMNVDPSISSDGSTLYFARGVWGASSTWDIWQAPILPVVDFNGDGIVDSADMCILIDNWRTDNPLCDIGPSPWGDGIVDVQDLIVLAEHLFTYPGAVAYWMLDETGGDIAYDSVGSYNGTLFGSPIWQPNDGIVAGALQFDGVNDYVSTDSVLNPADGSFSVFAWIKGGAPGQVIISQADTVVDSPRGPKIAPGSTWLGVDASSGTFMTGLSQTPYVLLVSESVITDAQWHHIGLVYDAIVLRRYLYVDGIEVAADADPANNLPCEAGLHIGSGQSLDPTSFFSGLIDDVRIYNRTLTTREIEALAQ